MCGIAGFVTIPNTDPSFENRADADLRSMLETIRHRGPDAEGCTKDAEHGVWLGHRRLSIIDLADGAQPMSTADGELVVTFNGEIYNHLELRADLEACGHSFTTDHSDTEVLLHGYREWGAALVSRLMGMWAFAIYDRQRQRLLLSRDRFAKKPLFYTRQRNTFAFASELHALTQHSRIDHTVSPLGLQKLFAYGYIPAPHSLFTGIHKLRGGENLVVDLPSLEQEIHTYWKFELEPDEDLARNEDEVCENLRHLLHQAVKRRLMSDVPLAIFLSGGIDSSALAAFAVKSAGAETIKSFAIGFQENTFDESSYARSVADLLGTEHYEKTLSMEVSADLLPEIAAKLDEPIGDSSILPTYLLCKEARERVTVALSGDGSDELFAGYDPFRVLGAANAYNRVVPRPLHQALRLLAARLPTSHRNLSLDFKIKRTLQGLSYPRKLWNPVWMGPLDPTELTEFLAESIDVENVYSEAIEAWETCDQPNLVDKSLQFYTQLYLTNDILVKVDRAGMMNSLEVRAPFLDHDLVDYVRRLPHRLKYRGGTTKYILKKALEPLLPESILYRSKKGFGAPVGRWFQEGRLGFQQGDASSSTQGESPRRFLDERLRQQRSGSHDHRLYLWSQWLLNNSRYFKAAT